MMQLCKEKNCWLKDLDDVPSIEFQLWMAFYELEEQEYKRQKRRVEAESRMRRHS